jgi:hypothetical protein
VKIADLDPTTRARLAAKLVLDVGWDAIAEQLPQHRITPPAPGVAVLACRCGRVLSLDQLHRQRQRRTNGGAPRIETICCLECAS